MVVLKDDNVGHHQHRRGSIDSCSNNGHRRCMLRYRPPSSSTTIAGQQDPKTVTSIPTWSSATRNGCKRSLSQSSSHSSSSSSSSRFSTSFAPSSRRDPPSNEASSSGYVGLKPIKRMPMFSLWLARDSKAQEESPGVLVRPVLLTEYNVVGFEEKLRESIFAEAKLLRNLARHPNVVPCNDLIHASALSKICLVYIFPRGGTLSKYLRRLEDGSGRNLNATALLIFVQVLLAVKRWHEIGLAHRHLQPDNIYLQFQSPSSSSSSACCVSSTAFSIQHPSSTPFGSLPLVKVGPPNIAAIPALHDYSPPETLHAATTRQCVRGSPPSDIWQLGCLLFTLLSSTVPFISADRKSLMHAILHRPIPILPAAVRMGIHGENIQEVIIS